MLTDIVKRGLLTARGVVGFWKANSKVVIVILLVIIVSISLIIPPNDIIQIRNYFNGKTELLLMRRRDAKSGKRACAIFSPAVLIFGLCTRKNVKLDHPAQIITCTIKHSCANF